MKVIDPGHQYQLQVIDGDDLFGKLTILRFVKRVGSKFPGNLDSYPGTNCQEPLRAIVDRLNYLNNQKPDVRTISARDHLIEAIYLLEHRAAELHSRKPPTKSEALNEITCQKCGHVGCTGSCHK